MDSFKNVDFEELCDILSSQDCLKLPTSENIRGIIKKISHKEILQEPQFVIECWKPVFQTALHITRSKLDEIYEKNAHSEKIAATHEISLRHGFHSTNHSKPFKAICSKLGQIVPRSIYQILHRFKYTWGRHKY